MPSQTHTRIVELTREAFDIEWRHQRHRPSATTVREQLWTIGRLQIPPAFPAYPFPSHSWVVKRIRPWEMLGVDLSDLWSIDSAMDDLDTAAVGALVTVWKHVSLTPYAEPFTVELAKWVSRLRYIPEAGGSKTGEVSDPDKILRWAAQFSAREKAAQAANEEKDPRTDIVLAKMMMSDVEFLEATHVMVLNKDGIDLKQELLTYYPRSGEQATKEAGYLDGERLDIATYTEASDEIFNSHPHKVQVVYGLVMKLALANEEWVTLRDDDKHPGIGLFMAYALLSDIAEWSDSGRPLGDYDPQEAIDYIMAWAVDSYDKEGRTI
jgi:hypothetical protein